MTKKNFLKSLAFIALFLYLLITITYIIRTNGDVKDRYTGFYAEKNNTIDMVMIGSSPVYPYYATPKMWGEYGISGYSLSSNLQRPVAAKYMVEEALKTQSPELFVFEMRMFTARETDLTNNMAYTRGVTDNMKYSVNRIKTINAMVDDVWDRYTYYFDIFKYHSNWKTMVMPSQLACFRFEKKEDQLGYVITDEVGPCERVDTSAIIKQKPMPAAQEEALRDLLTYLRENELEALFIVSPTVMEEEKQMMYNYMAKIIAKEGYEFLDLNKHNDEIALDYSADFSDYGGHTNAVGANKCTEFLAKYLVENYRLEDKRGQVGYAHWNQAYEQWQIEYEVAKGVIAKRMKEKDFADLTAQE